MDYQTVKQYAEQMQVPESTVLIWINDEKIKGCYKLPNGEWRIPMGLKPGEDIKVDENLELLRLKRDIEIDKLGFKDINTFNERSKLLTENLMIASKENVEEYKKSVDKLKLDQDKLKEDQDRVKTELANIETAKNDLAKDVQRNINVKETLKVKARESKDKEDKANADIKKRLETFDSFAEKIYECKTGKNCYGLILRGKKWYSEFCVMDLDFQEDILGLLKPILESIGHKPLFDDEGHYIPITSREDYLKHLEETYKSNEEGEETNEY
jgi:hypothetical protein